MPKKAVNLPHTRSTQTEFSHYYVALETIQSHIVQFRTVLDLLLCRKARIVADQIPFVGLKLSPKELVLIVVRST